MPTDTLSQVTHMLWCTYRCFGSNDLYALVWCTYRCFASNDLDTWCALTSSQDGVPFGRNQISALGIGISMTISHFTGFHFDLERPETEESLVKDQMDMEMEQMENNDGKNQWKIMKEKINGK